LSPAPIRREPKVNWSRIGNRENLAKARCFALALAPALPQVQAKQSGGLMPFLFIISELHPLVRV